MSKKDTRTVKQRNKAVRQEAIREQLAAYGHHTQAVNIIEKLGSEIAELTGTDLGQNYLHTGSSYRKGNAHDWFYRETGCIQYLIEVGTENMQPNNDDLIAVVGPCISQLSYQVSKEFKDQFITKDQSYSLFFEEDGREHFRFSLSNFILNLSERSKIENCEIIRRDNYTETETFFSYRRSKFNQEKDYGRCISAITMIF